MCYGVKHEQQRKYCITNYHSREKIEFETYDTAEKRSCENTVRTFLFTLETASKRAFYTPDLFFQINSGVDFKSTMIWLNNNIRWRDCHQTSTTIAKRY